MTFSHVAARRGIPNDTGPQEIANLQRTAVAMAQVRTILGNLFN
jgi:hypothetical protein